MYIFGDGTDVKIIGSMEDLDKMKITNDYFRINQSLNIGWYIVRFTIHIKCNNWYFIYNKCN
jgi:hypothetical protein